MKVPGYVTFNPSNQTFTLDKNLSTTANTFPEELDSVVVSFMPSLSVMTLRFLTIDRAIAAVSVADVVIAPSVRLKEFKRGVRQRWSYSGLFKGTKLKLDSLPKSVRLPAWWSDATVLTVGMSTLLPNYTPTLTKPPGFNPSPEDEGLVTAAFYVALVFGNVLTAGEDAQQRALETLNRMCIGDLPSVSEREYFQTLKEQNKQGLAKLCV